MIAALFTQLVRAEKWAVLMAGSKGYRNYRHQADVFQMYQILRSRGFKKDHIITMAYDDIVNSNENPYPGYIYNIKKYVSVYPGKENIQYRGNDVSPENFNSVMTGKANPRGLPVLKSTKDDDVFFYYNDHGFPGYLCAPSGGHISGEDLLETVDEMERQGRFGKLFIAIEACYSGSVAKLFKGRKNVAIITAANSIQSSYSHGYDYEIETFRTNEWTNRYMRFILAHPNSTIEGLLNFTKMLTYGSDVRFYGDKNMLNEKLERFLGKAKPLDINYENAEIVHNPTRISSMKTDLAYLKHRLESAKDTESATMFRAMLDQEKMRRSQAKRTFDDITLPLEGRNDRKDKKLPKDTKWKCYKAAVKYYQEMCGEIQEAVYENMGTFAHICQDHDIETIKKSIAKNCPKKN